MQQEEQKYRLVTRSNFDGIISATLLLKLDLVDEMLFVHPKEVQDGNVKIDEHDIVTNLPYVKDAYMAFDHKFDSHDKIQINTNHTIFTDAKSVSEIIYEYNGGDEVFGEKFALMVEAANKSKSANFSKEEVLSPSGWDLLIFLTDPRTGLGRFQDFKISNYALMQKLPTLCLEKDIEGILADEDVKERVDIYTQYHQNFIDQLKRCTTVDGDIAVINFSEEDVIYPGNRFMVYALFPEVSGSIHVFQGVSNQNIVLALGKSIFNTSNKHNIYEIVKKYDGGGHEDAGTCQVSHKRVDTVLKDLVNLFTTK